MTDIFISYKKEDAGRVIRVVEALRAEGLTVWWDHGIRAGSEWDKTIHQELYAANVVIAIWSEASVAAPWVKEEATVGKNRGVLLPVKIDEVDPPLGFMMIQAADLVGWKGDRKDPRWGHFLESVHAILRNEAPAVRSDAPLKTKPKPAGLTKPLIAGGAVLAVLLIGALFVPGLLRDRGSIAPTAPTTPVTAPPSAPNASQPSAPAEPKPSVPAAPPPSAAPPPPPTPQITESEQKLWDQAMKDKTRQGFQTYLVAYPNGAYAPRARDILLTCHTETRDTWKPESAPNQISRGVGDTSSGTTQEQACNKAKGDARAQAKSTCEAITSNGGYRNPDVSFTDNTCMCNKTSPRITVCVADIPYSCRWEMKIPERVETCG